MKHRVGELSATVYARKIAGQHDPICIRRV